MHLRETVSETRFPCCFTDRVGCYAEAAHGDHMICDCACHMRLYDYRCKECQREYTIRQSVSPGTMVCHDCGTGREISWWRKRPAA